MSLPKPYYEAAGVTLYHGDCLRVLPELAAGSVDAVITDPPYAEVSREYGRLSEPDWHALMQPVVREVRRVLTPCGSAMFVIQPNSERIGKLRLWVWEFMAWVGNEWNIIQDAYWWNHCTLPSVGACSHGLLRGSLKPLVWCGPPDCYRNQDAVLWEESQENAARRLSARAGRRNFPSGHSINEAIVHEAAARRGGVTPFNVLPIPAANSVSSAGAYGHGAGTPLPLCDWWARYISRPGDTVLDPFTGSGTTGVACIQLGRKFIGVEQEEQYCEIAAKRLEKAARECGTPLLDASEAAKPKHARPGKTPGRRVGRPLVAVTDAEGRGQWVFSEP